MMKKPDPTQEIFRILRDETDDLPAGAPFPSLRRIQRRFGIGQATATRALRLLAEHYGASRRERTKMRKPEIRSASRLFLREAVLLICENSRTLWEPVVGDYNSSHDGRIVLKVLPDVESCVDASRRGEGDFVLFPANPFTLGLLMDSLCYVDLGVFSGTLRREDFYPSVLLTDHEERFWGISAYLNTMVLSFNPKYCDIPLNDWTWKSITPKLEQVKREHPELDYAFILDGYVSFLFDSGVSMVDDNSGRVRFDAERFYEPLCYLRRMLDAGLMPLFSDIYMHKWDRYRLYGAGRAGVCQSFHSAIVRYPQFPVLPSPGEVGTVHCVQSEIFSILAGSMNYESAWNFISYALSEKVQAELMTRVYAMPSRRNVCPRPLSSAQFDYFVRSIEQAAVRPEDYWFPHQARMRLASGLDMWFRRGGDLRVMLRDLERSCQQCVDFTLKQIP